MADPQTTTRKRPIVHLNKYTEKELKLFCTNQRKRS